MCVPNLVPIGPEMATCIRLEGYTHTHTHTHTLSYIDIDRLVNMMPMLWYSAVPRFQCLCLCMVGCIIIMLFSECFGVKYPIKNSG